MRERSVSVSDRDDTYCVRPHRRLLEHRIVGTNSTQPAGGYDSFFAFKMKLGNICGIINDVHQTRSFLSKF